MRSSVIHDYPSRGKRKNDGKKNNMTEGGGGGGEVRGRTKHAV